MAALKEAMVIIIDIGKNSLQKDPDTDETFFDKEKSCWTKILQRKIFSAKKDEVGVILMGSHETDNELNRSMEGYEHLREALPLAIPTWAMLRNLENHVQHEGADADWLDALILAMDLLRRETVAKKFGNFKIVLFSTFSTYVNDDNVSFVIQGLKKLDIELVVIGHNVEVPELLEDGPSQGIFTQKENKSEHQRLSEELVKRIIEESNGYLCNFEYAINHLINFQRRKARPWYWNSTLDIGSKIKIHIAATIAVKEENHFKWEKESAVEGTSCWTTDEYFNNGEKIEPQAEDLIKGYMLGATPLAYDESIITMNPTQKGLRCLLFTKRSNLLEEYLGGNGCYLILPKKDQTASAKMLFALIKAMEKSEMIMIGSRVYANGNKPKLVALVPNSEREFPCLSMFELFYADQYFYWNFPLLRTRKTEPSAEQYAAIDKLIDSMDLMNVDDGTSHPKEAFPHRHLVNLSLQHIYETITKRALQPQRPVPTLDGRLLETVQVPAKVKKASENAIKEIKELFPLADVEKASRRELIRKIGDIPAETNENSEAAAPSDAASTEPWALVEVGTVTPAEDFLLLIERGEEFSVLSKQIKNIITDLIFKSMTDQNEKIAKAMMAFREEAKFYAPWEYTEWIKELKNSLIAGKKFDFWEKVVVKDELGIIPISESDLVTSITDEEAAEFYKIGTRTEATSNADAGESVDDMFDNM